ncbi:MAG TPA: type IVB secretion system protein IcmH/DotU [Burkholderiaceae bacterium]
MTAGIERRTAAKLAARTGSRNGQSLLEAMADGFYALFILQRGALPHDEAALRGRMTHFLAEFETRARMAGFDADNIEHAKYAFCATVDETVLRSALPLRGAWERKPLQLTLFGDQLAGEHFFTRLDTLRLRGVPLLPALEVYHMCLLLGFQGKYLMAAAEQCQYLTARLGDEIAGLKGRPAGFAPHGARPDQIVNRLRAGLSGWVLLATFSLLGMGAYAGMETSLAHEAGQASSAYGVIVKPALAPAVVTVTLP